MAKRKKPETLTQAKTLNDGTTVILDQVKYTDEDDNERTTVCVKLFNPYDRGRCILLGHSEAKELVNFLRENFPMDVLSEPEDEPRRGEAIPCVPRW